VIYAADGSRVWGDGTAKPAEGKTNRDNADRGGVLTVYALAPFIFSSGDAEQPVPDANSELDPDAEPADSIAVAGLLMERELTVVFQAKIASPLR
jgi:hypothetical protein